MSFTAPLRYEGEGEFRATLGHAKRCDRDLVIGAVYAFEEIKPRSKKSHDHFFVLVDEAWANLPEALAMQYPNATTLRKRALIKAGYCTTKHIVCASHEEAIGTCAFLAGMDRYALCQVSDAVVTVWQAKSQSMKAMPGKEFQQSKTAVMDEISKLLGVSIEELAKAEAA